MTLAGQRMGTGAIFAAAWFVTAGFVIQPLVGDQTDIELVGRSTDERVLA